MDITNYFKKQRLDPGVVKTQRTESLNDTAVREIATNCFQNEPMPLSTAEDSAEWDIGRYICKELDDFSREKLLTSCWVPPENFSFPSQQVGKRNLRFQMSWFKQFNWLTYSKHLQGAFCKFCVVFSPETCGKGGHQRLGALVKKPYLKWKNAKDDFANHAKTTYHQTSCEYADNFLRVAKGKQQTIENQLITEKKKQDVEMRRVLQSIIKTIILCGRQEIALRGSCDSGNVTDQDNDVNDGNFRTLLRFRVDAGDAILLRHLEHGPRNSQYTSPTIQNELIDLCAKYIQEHIVRKVNLARYFSVLCDETTDISGVEQLTLCVRYVDKKEQKLCEDFLLFAPATDGTGLGLSSLILSKLKFLNLNCNYLIGQGYDGARAMSGYLHGAQAYIRKECPMALYIHCGAHSLNLALGDSCTIPSIRNCIGTIQSVGTIFRSSSKNNEILKGFIKELLPTSRHTTLISMCETRWVYKHEAILRFRELYVAVVLSLQNLQDVKNRESAQKAHQLFCAVTQGQFVVALCILDLIFSWTLPLSKTLQNVDCDLVTSLEHADLIISSLDELRGNALDKFGVIFNEATKLISEVGGVITMPRVSSKMTQRGNVSSKTPEEYYLKNLFVPFVDHVRTQIQDRFSNHKTLVIALQIFLPRHVTLNCEEKLTTCKDFYESLLPESKTLIAEYSLWRKKWIKVDVNSRPGNAMEALLQCDSNLFPNSHTLLQILATIPISTATPERTFSTLRRLKTYLRNSSVENRLTGLALLATHRNIDVQPDEILNRFIKSSRRAHF